VAFVARLVCSDAACAAVVAGRAADVRELEAVACACGCGLQVLGWPDAEDGGGDGALELVVLAG
jgi:hypothetical protein